MATFYDCPRCGLPYVTGYVDDAGQEHWTCNAKGCGARERPVGARRPRARAPHLAPVERRRLRRALVEPPSSIPPAALMDNAGRVRPPLTRNDWTHSRVAWLVVLGAVVGLLLAVHMSYGGPSTTPGPAGGPGAPGFNGYQVVCKDAGSVTQVVARELALVTAARGSCRRLGRRDTRTGGPPSRPTRCRTRVAGDTVR